MDANIACTLNNVKCGDLTPGCFLAASTQWEIVDAVANPLLPVYEQLIREAAQGDVLYNDDTTIKILSLIKEQTDSQDDLARKGMFTSAIIF